ncbi:tyrosine-type recombinase/integrase [Gandjariella thermophila]|uniref:Integrase n=1 Tax=Gandjariella thermophila TaxID=1931992 RepID=A0A4D4JGV8_9PSEU|nr:tyrosine-type recombinase/integrase [Gandjariella thermophila]GDY33636.1 hypothetical protein GTS_52690 [Gandjariella thermophila]
MRLGHPDVDRYLEFVAARARRNTLLAVGFDLKVFFTVVTKDPAAVTTADVYAFIAAQRAPRHGPRVVRLEDGEPGLAARTIKRRLSSVSGLFGYLIARGDAGVTANPVPCGLATRRPGAGRARRGGALIRTPRTLPRIVAPGEVDVFYSALRTHRDRAMTLAMLLGGLRRCEVLGLGLADVHPGLRRVFIADGKGGAQRYVPIAPRFFTELAAYLEQERPEDAATDRVFVALKRPQRGGPLTADGLDEIVENACHRAGLQADLPPVAVRFRLPGDFQTRFDLANRGRKSSWLPPRSIRTSCVNGRCACTGSPIPSR